jgi:uncharacterized protein (DUF2236 family)
MPAVPASAEIPSLVPRQDSILWRYGSDARVLTTAGYALVLQVAHPTVGAGVREHSNYREDPWGRLLRTLDFVNLVVYGGPEAAEATAHRLRKMHKQIQGTDPDGRRYYALEPEAYAWVHATLVDGIVTGHRRFGLKLSDEEVEELYADWLALGRIIGVGDDQLPGDWASFRDYFDRMISERLEDNDVIHGVLEVLARPAAPPLPFLKGPAWRALRFPLARLGALATVGLLPPLLRERFSLRWTRTQERELRALGALSRSATPLMPVSLKVMGPGYLRWRRDAISKGEFGDAVPDIRTLASAA